MAPPVHLVLPEARVTDVLAVTCVLAIVVGAIGIWLTLK